MYRYDGSSGGRGRGIRGGADEGSPVGYSRSLDDDHGWTADFSSSARRGVSAASSHLAGEVVRDGATISGWAEGVDGFEPVSFPENFVRGLCNGQGVIEVKNPYAESSIQKLHKQVLGLGEPVQVGADVLVHTVGRSPEAGSSGQGFSQYVALVAGPRFHHSDGLGDFGDVVPLTEIDESSLGDPSDVSHWRHPAFFAHLRWLAGNGQGFGSIDGHPTFVVPQQTSKLQMRDRATYCAFLDAAFARSRFAMLKALNNDHFGREPVRSCVVEDASFSHVTPQRRAVSLNVDRPMRLPASAPSGSNHVSPYGGEASEVCLPRKGGGWLSKITGALRTSGSDSPARVRSRTPSVSERPSRSGVVLPSKATLGGRRPETRGLSRGEVFIDKQQTPNLCGVAAINGFFQTPVLAGKHAVKEIVNSYLGILDGKEGAKLLRTLPGLFHPKVVRAMRQGVSVTISRDEFFHVPETALNDVMYPALNEEALAEGLGSASEEVKNQTRVAEQWRAYFNFKYPGQANREALIHDSQAITISPDEWISTFAGLSFEHLIQLTNDLLKTKNTGSAWRDYPDSVAGLALSTDEFQKLGQLEHLSRLVDRLGVKHLICMAGGGMTGHYFALVKNDAGHWFKADGANPLVGTGVQRVMSSNVARPGDLSKKLLDWGVTHVIADQQLIDAFQRSVGE